MKKFLVLYRSNLSNEEQMKRAKPGQAQAVMEAWATWSKKHGAALVELGAPLGDSAVIKGTPGQGHIGGYSIVQGESLDAAKRMFEGHPHFGAPGGGASIELLELMSMPGM